MSVVQQACLSVFKVVVQQIDDDSIMREVGNRKQHASVLFQQLLRRGDKFTRVAEVLQYVSTDYIIKLYAPVSFKPFIIFGVAHDKIFGILQSVFSGLFVKFDEIHMTTKALF